MEKIFEQALLYDFYGELLTEHQRCIYEDAVYNDLSLSEIAEEQGISRQGVHDLIKRCDKILQDYESKLHLAERFVKAKETVKKIQELSGSAEATVGRSQELSGGAEATVGRIQEASDGIGDTRREFSAGNVSRESDEDLRIRMHRIGELAEELLKEL